MERLHLRDQRNSLRRFVIVNYERNLCNIPVFVRVNYGSFADRTLWIFRPGPWPTFNEPSVDYRRADGITEDDGHTCQQMPDYEVKAIN